MMADEQAKTVVRGALFLTLAGFLSKVLSASYRIPLQNLTGDLGFYMYQQVYPMIGMATILALYGYPAAVSKIIAERRRFGQVIDFRHVYRPLLVILLGVNGVFAGMIYLFAPKIAHWMQAPELTDTFQLAALLFLLLPFLALLRGVWQGYDNMRPTAYSQMAEQFIRVVFIIMSASLIFTKVWPVEMIGTAGVWASLLGMGAATCIWLLRLPGVKRASPLMQHEPVPWRYYLRVCFSLGIIAALSHMVLILLQLADVMTLVPQLIKYGLLLEEAMRTKGVFDRGWPLIQFGVVIGSSFALALVPSVIIESEARARAIQEAMVFSFYIAAGATLGLIVLMPEVNVLLYQNTAGTSSLQILALSILFSSAAITACAILQSMGHIKRVALLVIITFAVKWGLNLVLVPYISIHGSAIATGISLYILMHVVIKLLQKQMPDVPFIRQMPWTALMIAGGSMAAYLLGFKQIFSVPSARILLLFYVLFLIITGAGIFMFVLFRLSAFSDQQLQALPYGDYFVDFKKRIEKKKEDEDDV